MKRDGGVGTRIEVFTLRNRRIVAKLQTDFGLGKGDAEAIALALDEKAEIVGIDDKNGIDACKVLGIAFTTAVGILIRSPASVQTPLFTP